MRILVISDSHGRVNAIDKAILEQKDVKDIFFLGDRLEDIEQLIPLYPERRFHLVSGNCDYNSSEKSQDVITLDNVKILFTHGHNFSVKYGLSRIREAAKQISANLVLYGHTHVANTEYVDGIYFVNPGSLSSPREGGPSYAFVDIEKGGIKAVIRKV